MLTFSADYRRVQYTVDQCPVVSRSIGGGAIPPDPDGVRIPRGVSTLERCRVADRLIRFPVRQFQRTRDPGDGSAGTSVQYSVSGRPGFDGRGGSAGGSPGNGPDEGTRRFVTDSVGSRLTRDDLPESGRPHCQFTQATGVGPQLCRPDRYPGVFDRSPRFVANAHDDGSTDGHFVALEFENESAAHFHVVGYHPE